MQKLTLNDGTVLENSHVILNGSTLWFYLTGITFTETFNVMNDASRTETITADSFGDVTAYEGFTDLFCLRREDDGMITGGLKHA